MKYPTRLLSSAAALLVTTVAATATMAFMATSASALKLPKIDFSNAPFTTRTTPTNDDFEDCAAILMGLEMNVATIADACGAAREPKALAECVSGISVNTSVTSDEALAGCVRVRRPLATADCVVVLDGELNQAMSSQVLGYCSRSLLPEIFKNCVEGLYNPDLAETPDAMVVMNACVEVGYDAPTVFLPTFDPVISQ